MTSEEFRTDKMEVMEEIRYCCEEIGTLTGLIEDLSQVLLEMQDEDEEEKETIRELREVFDQLDGYLQRLASARKRLEELQKL